MVGDLLALLWVPFLMCLVLTGIHAYLGVHVLAREVVFVDIAMAQIAALGATAAFLFGYETDMWQSYAGALAATLVGAVVLALTRSRQRRVSQEAVIGVVYAVLSYTIAERTREVGVRLALGAQPRAVLRMLLGTGARVAAVGIGAGLILSFMLTGVVANQLYGLTATDPVTMAAASALLFSVALLASFVPAWRATRIDPVAALRQR